MKIEFLDGTQLDVIVIFGGPRLIDGVMRDTLMLEFDPKKYELSELTTHFQDDAKCMSLFSYTEENINGEITLQKNKIGDGYTVFISAESETRRIQPPPGVLAPEETESVNVVTIAQITYQEYIDATSASEE